MMKNDRQRFREWLAEHPQEFVLDEAAQATGVSRGRLAFLINDRGMAEIVGQRYVRRIPPHGRGGYYIKVYRRAEA